MKVAFKKILSLFFFLTLFEPVHSQTHVRDSLVRLYHETSSKKIELDELEHLDLLNEIAWQYRYVNSDSMLFYAQKAHVLAQTAKDKVGLITVLSLFGNYYSDIGQHKLATEYFERAYDLVLEEGKKEFEVEIISELANQYDFNGHPGESLKMYKKGISLAREINYVDLLSIMHTNLAILYGENDFHKEALQGFLIADSINLVLEDTLAIVQNNINLSYQVLKLGNEKEAKNYAAKAIDLLEKMNYPDWLAYAYLNMGEICLEQNQINDAFHWLSKAKKINDGLDDYRSSMELELAMGKCKKGFGELDSSEYYLNKSLVKAKILRDDQAIEKALEELYKLQIEKNNSTKALDFLSQFTAIKKSNDSLKTKNNLILIGAEIDFKEFQNETKLRAQKKIERQDLITYASTILLLALCITTILLRNNAINQKRINTELSKANIEKDRVFSILGKNLKAPIASLQEFLELKNVSKLTQSEVTNLIPEFQRNVDDSSFTLENILFWAKIEMNSIAVHKTTIEIKTCVNDITNNFKRQIQKKNLSIKNVIMAGSKVCFDPNHLDMIIKNLLHNAIKYTPDGGSIAFEAKKNGEFTQITISDTGIGISEKTLNSIESQGFSVSDFNKSGEIGPGLGLFIAKKLIMFNNGELHIESNSAYGSSFHLLVPIC